MQRIVILGGGTAGTIMANRLARLNRSALRAGQMELTVVDRDDSHVYQPGLLFIPFGKYTSQDLVKPRQNYFPAAAKYVRAGVDHADIYSRTVVLESGQHLDYDVLVIASGSHVAPEETDGMLGPGVAPEGM